MELRLFKAIGVVSVYMAVICATQYSSPASCSLLPPSTLQDVLTAAHDEGDGLIMLCDVGTSDVRTSDVGTSDVRMSEVGTSDVQTSECPAEDVLAVWPAVYMTMDLTNRSLIVQMLETQAAPRKLTWLVFCARCDVLMGEIKVFEETPTHNLHGYFTHRYQWILVPDSDDTVATITKNAGSISNVLVIGSRSIYAIMFGASERYAQEIRPFDHVSVSKPIGLTNHDLFPNTRNGFNNRTLTMVVLPWLYNVIEVSPGKYSGYNVEVFEMIAKQLNFSIRFVQTRDGKFGNLLENGSWTGLVGMLVNKEADVVSLLTSNKDRNKVVEFMNTAVETLYEAIIYHKPEPAGMSLAILLQPFSRDVWIAFGGAVFITMLAIHLSDNVLGHGRNGFQFVFSSTFNQGSIWTPSCHGGRLIYGVYHLSCIILISTYTGFLVSVLSVKKDVIPFRTFVELAANNEYTLGVLGGSNLYGAIFNGENYTSVNPKFHIRKKLERDFARDPTVFHKDIQFQLDRLVNDYHAFYGTSKTYEQLASFSCSVAMLEEKGSIQFDGFAFRKNSAYAKDVDDVLRVIQEGRLDYYLRQRYFPQPTQCSPQLYSVTLENINGFFYILCAGVGVACAILLLEIARNQTSGPAYSKQI